MDAVCPVLVPVTVKFKGFAVVGVRPVTVTLLDPPTPIEAGLKVQVAPEPQAREMISQERAGARRGDSERRGRWCQ